MNQFNDEAIIFIVGFRHFFTIKLKKTKNIFKILNTYL